MLSVCLLVCNHENHRNTCSTVPTILCCTVLLCSVHTTNRTVLLTVNVQYCAKAKCQPTEPTCIMQLLYYATLVIGLYSTFTVIPNIEGGGRVEQFMPRVRTGWTVFLISPPSPINVRISTFIRELMATTSVCIVGAGICGLSTALSLVESNSGYDITIVADKFSPDTTSNVAAAIILPFIVGPDTPMELQKCVYYVHVIVLVYLFINTNRYDY